MVGKKVCKKCGEEKEFGHVNTKFNGFSLYRADKRGQGARAYENVCKDCRREQIYASVARQRLHPSRYAYSVGLITFEE
jgi:hypothetical protein